MKSMSLRLIERPRSIPIMVFVTLALLTLAGLAILYQNERLYQAQKVSEAQVQADILGASATAALDFGDTIAGQDFVNALGLNPQVETAAVYNADGTLFAGFNRLGAQPPLATSELPPTTAGVVATHRPIVRGGERIGSAYVALAREGLFRRFARYSLVGLLILIAGIAVTVLGVAHSALRNAAREAGERAKALSEAYDELQVQVEERAKAEEQLRQAQKMQALGQLTGGIAHDFNNLLTVIQGSADILQRPGLPEDKRARFAAAISQTAARAAALTSQLLSFARRQPLRPETLHINEQVIGMVDLLDRTLGERVLVKTELSPDIGPVEVDPIQLESAVLNIAVNARDAMPDGGELTIRTAPATLDDGQQAIALSISDTGNGMDEETMGRVFEPFFTTKEVGKGTGLGLSQVYGFASQSGGEVRIDSGAGKGTTVTMILPCTEARPDQATDDGAEKQARMSAGGCILVVDDNEEVGAFAEALLEELGYDVTRARSGDEALSLFAPGRFDGVLSDVVMPGMSGIELAGALREREPSLPIILTTGFSDQLAEGGQGYPVLLKPYKLHALAEVLEKAIA